MLTFPPLDCDGEPLQCGDSINFIAIVGGKRTLDFMQITGITQENDVWHLSGLTPFGTSATLVGVENVRKVKFHVPQLTEGVDGTLPQDRAD